MESEKVVLDFFTYFGNKHLRKPLKDKQTNLEFFFDCSTKKYKDIHVEGTEQHRSKSNNNKISIVDIFPILKMGVTQINSMR